MKSILFQIACAFGAAFCLGTIVSEQTLPLVEDTQILSCHKCNKPACKGCGGMIACEQCGGKCCTPIAEEPELELAGCSCGRDDNKEKMIACKKCGGKKKKNLPGAPKEAALV